MLRMDQSNSRREWAREADGRRFQLIVEQQPIRARMCGFGDKDRRPITPPPCVRLSITHKATGKECDVNEIDFSKFVLNVELWSGDGLKESNLVRHSATSPTISNSIPSSYADATSITKFSPVSQLSQGPSITSDAQFRYDNQPQWHNPPPAYNPYPGPPQVNPYPQHPPQQAYGAQQYPPGYSVNGHQPGGFPAQYATPQAPFYPSANVHAMAPANMTPMGHPGVPPMGNSALQPGVDYALPSQPLPPQSSLTSYGGRPFVAADLNIHRMPPSSTAPTGMFTRNLIGSLSASASRLTDPNDRIGIWFVLQDLSIRTEGTFRLRFSFVNVGAPSQRSPSSSSHSSSSSRQQANVNTGSAQVLACTFSEPFQVFSAKKFPGVVDSTPLSKCFATQGIKIPIRKDTLGKDNKAGDEFEDE